MFKTGDKLRMVNDCVGLVGYTDQNGYTYKLGDVFEVVDQIPDGPEGEEYWIAQAKVCESDLEYSVNQAFELVEVA